MNSSWLLRMTNVNFDCVTFDFSVEILRINTQWLKSNELDEIQRTSCYKFHVNIT